MKPPTPIAERFWPKVQKTDGCWIWLGGKSKGYGYISKDGGGCHVPAHRVAYELVVGPIPDGMVLDHLCRNRACVNPYHLEPVTNKTNILRGEHPPARYAKRTHCAHGHEFTPENTFMYRGYRCCRQCNRENARKTYARNKQRRNVVAS